MSYRFRPSYLSELPSTRSLAGWFLLATPMLLALGCGGPEAVKEPIVADPVADFEWGMERLERALQFRPSGNDGLHVIGRKLNYKLFPPDSDHPDYRASVTVVTETAYLQENRPEKKNEESEEEAKEIEIDDPLADKSDEINKLLEFKGAGPRAPARPAPKIKTLNTKTESVFELVYTEEHWKLSETPEKKHEALWFEYAFD